MWNQQGERTWDFTVNFTIREFGAQLEKKRQKQRVSDGLNMLASIGLTVSTISPGYTIWMGIFREIIQKCYDLIGLHIPQWSPLYGHVLNDTEWNCLAKKTTGLYLQYLVDWWQINLQGMGLENHFMTSRQICIFMWKIREMCFGYNQWSSNFRWISSCWVQNGGYSTWQFLTHEPWWETTPFWVPLLVDPSSTCFNELQIQILRLGLNKYPMIGLTR